MAPMNAGDQAAPDVQETDASVQESTPVDTEIIGEAQSIDAIPAAGLIGEMQSADAASTAGMIGETQSADVASTADVIGEMQSADASQATGLIGEMQSVDASLATEMIGATQSVDSETGEGMPPASAALEIEDLESGAAVQPRARHRLPIAAAILVIIALLAVGGGVGYYYTMGTGAISRQLDLGNKYLLEEDYEQAVIAFNKVIAIDPRRAEAYEGLIDAYTGAGDYSAALGAYQSGSEYMQELPEEEQAAYYDHLITLSEAVRDNDTADAQQTIDWCEELLAYDPSLIAAYEGLIGGRLEQDDVEDAYNDYIDAVDAVGQTPDAPREALEPYREQLAAALERVYKAAEEPSDRLRLLQYLITLCPDDEGYQQDLPLVQYLANHEDALRYLLEQCEQGDMTAICDLYNSDEYASVCTDWPEELTSAAWRQNGETLVVLYCENDLADPWFLYYGEVQDGVASGQGRIYAQVGDVTDPDTFGYDASYSGEWQNNMPNGAGTVIENYNDGMTMSTVGTFADGVESGTMTRTYARSGSQYTYNYTVGDDADYYTSEEVHGSNPGHLILRNQQGVFPFVNSAWTYFTSPDDPKWQSEPTQYTY